ncbi:hypothetical protein BACCIP111883_01633 [Sutcliffiella rhizosphaerae]|uniref:ArpU family transcriptional regulator n=1 Tax=Sutcliffiella rhizosphaerae TaxID=2880967 RepID=A0ABN8AB37_9BACI|nr:hypothetical protein BACCIP111883_01633 [Sutcliffiella rhizosphaerae]
MSQLQFKLPEIDRELTKKAVESALEKYRFYLLTIPEEKLPRITPAYSLVPPSNTNEFHSSTEDAVIGRVDGERERLEYIERIRRAVNRLSSRERELIIKRYLEEDEVYDYEIYNDKGMSERQYYRFKGRMFYKLAFLLKIEVYKNNEHPL